MEPGARPWCRNQAGEFIHLEDLKGPTANTVVDNSEVVHKVGIAIELCGNNSQFKSDMSLILLWLILSHKSCGSYLYGNSALRLRHNTPTSQHCFVGIDVHRMAENLSELEPAQRPRTLLWPLRVFIMYLPTASVLLQKGRTFSFSCSPVSISSHLMAQDARKLSGDTSLTGHMAHSDTDTQHPWALELVWPGGEAVPWLAEERPVLGHSTCVFTCSFGDIITFKYCWKGSTLE